MYKDDPIASRYVTSLRHFMRSTMPTSLHTIFICQLVVLVFSLSVQNIYGCQDGQLTLHPKIVPMLGGSLIVISGPCFGTYDDVIICDFEGAIVNGRVLTSSSAACISPALFYAGVIDVRLSLDQGSTYLYVGRILVDINQLAAVNLTAESSGNFTVTWDPTALNGINTVQIIAYEFTVTNVNTSERFSWKPVHILSRRTKNEAGSIKFAINQKCNVNGSSPRVGAVGIFEIDDANPSLGKRAIWSEIHTLNWLYPINSTSWCSAWVTQELSELDEWLPQRPVCPCTERKARRDIGSFTAFLDCRIGSRTDRACSTKYPGAIFCVNSNIPSPSNADQECCYNDKGHLIERGQRGAGFAHRRHNRASSSFALEGLGPVPVLSHFLADTMPYLQCCGADNRGAGDMDFCGQYHRVRPPNNCNGYEPPQPASAFGDPHFISFDGLNYTFNGYGEFTLANINQDEFILQARTLPMSETPNGTVIKAVATKTNNSDVIHVEANQRRGMSVFFRREGREFEELDLNLTNTWCLRGATVKADENSTAGGLFIIFDNDIVLTITAQDHACALLVTIPYRFKGKTQGMLGTWNGDIGDDLQRPDDVIISSDSSMETIFNDFGNMWRLSENASLFYYRTGYSQSSYANYTYTPLLIQPSFSLEGRVHHVCGNDQSCAFDLSVTGSEEFAVQTLNEIKRYESILCDLAPVSCEPVHLTNGRMTSTFVCPGSLAWFSCDPCYELLGPNTTTCGSNGSWLYPYPSCNPIVQCSVPNAPPNGHVVSGGCPITFANFTCMGGYDLKGSAIIECMPDGNWSDAVPKCQRNITGFIGLTVGVLVGGLAVFLLSCLIAFLARWLKRRKRKQALKKRLDRLWSTGKNHIETRH